MVQGPSFEVVSLLGDPTATVDDKVRVARQIKNLIIGHEQRKEVAVRHGIVEQLANIISSTSKSTGKRKLESDGVALPRVQEWSAEDELKLQSAIIVGSIAAEGQAFLQPLCAADLPKVLVEALSTETAPSLAVAILHSLKILASLWAAVEEQSADYDFWGAIFNVDSLDVFDSLLQRHTRATSTGRQQLTLIADIISAVPEHDGPAIKALIVNCGLLDTLACLLAAHAIEHKLVAYRRSPAGLPSSPSQVSLPKLLNAVATIIASSKYRVHRFVLAPAVRVLFDDAGVDDTEPYHFKTGATYLPANSGHSLLPSLHLPVYRNDTNRSSNSFPAMQLMQTEKSLEPGLSLGAVDDNNAVCGWLLVVARQLKGSDRLAALRLLSLVAAFTDTGCAPQVVLAWKLKSEIQQKARERQKQLALLAIPLAVQLLQTANDSKTPDTVKEQRDLKLIKEQACSVLALLIRGNKELQKAAVEAGAIKTTCSLLKKSFDNVQLARPMWSGKSNFQPDSNAPATCRLGNATLLPEISHVMRCRQGALRTLEALAAEEDLHRKAIIETGVVICIVDSLKPLPPSPSAAAHGRLQLSPKDGNTTQVILAACRAAQCMSRSVSVLRTSLIDGGIAKPLVSLLTHASLEVQIAATDVCCNLLPDFSPMREDITNGDVISTLVEHARSSSPALRLSSLWALKHLVFNCPKQVKLQTLDELGTGWLVDIIQGEQRTATSAPSGGGGVSVGLSTPNAAGEQVDLLNPSSMDLDEPGVNEEIMDEDDEDGEVLYDESSSTHYQSSQMRSTLDRPAPAFNSKRYLSSIREIEQNAEYSSRKDEAEIQIQALDFIRNLINGEDCAALSDYLMNQIGSAKVYDLLTAKLLPVTRSGARPVYNLTDLVLSTIHVIIHLANASPRHRQMLIAQKSLLQAMLPHFNHLDHRVRLMCVWAVNSLTWVEEEVDRKDARQRASELRTLGIEKAVTALQNDPNLDVRERVKTAMRQFDTL